MEMPPRANRGGAPARMAEAISAMVSPSSVEATVTGPTGQRAAIWGANISAVQARPGMRTMGVMPASLGGRRPSRPSRANSAVAALALALFAAALFPLIRALFALAFCLGLLVGGRHRVHARADDRGSRSDHGDAGSHDRAHQTAL